MKHTEGRTIIAFVFLISGLIGLFASAAPSQTIVTNPAKPLSANAYRVRTLTTVLTITDEGGEYYFKRPEIIQFGPDGSIYVLDEDQLLRFDAKGKFVRNYFRSGQGPGELTSMSGFAALDDVLVVHNVNPGKIVQYSLDGKLLADSPAVVKGGALRMWAASGRTCYFINSGRVVPSQIKGSDGIVDQSNAIVSMGVEGGLPKEWGSFPTRVFIQKAPGGGGVTIPLGKIFTALNGKFVAVSHTDEYAIKILDLETGAVVRMITREYARVKPSPEDLRVLSSGGPAIMGEVIRKPEPKFMADVSNLLSHGNEIWAVTSTKAPGRGTLIDVFSWEGTYRDCFYLALPAPANRHYELPDPQAIQGDFLAAIEKTGEGTYVIRKYRMENYYGEQ